MLYKGRAVRPVRRSTAAVLVPPSGRSWFSGTSRRGRKSDARLSMSFGSRARRGPQASASTERQGLCLGGTGGVGRAISVPRRRSRLGLSSGRFRQSHRSGVAWSVTDLSSGWGMEAPSPRRELSKTFMPCHDDEKTERDRSKEETRQEGPVTRIKRGRRTRNSRPCKPNDEGAHQPKSEQRKALLHEVVPHRLGRGSVLDGLGANPRFGVDRDGCAGAGLRRALRPRGRFLGER